MWPKAIAQLIELAPHVSRLVPLADRFFQNKPSLDATNEANRRAMDAMAEGLRGDLGQVTAAHAGLYRQLQDQGKRLVELTAEVEAAKRAVESVGPRLTGLERRLASNTTLLAITLLLNVIVVALVAGVLLHHPA